MALRSLTRARKGARAYDAATVLTTAELAAWLGLSERQVFRMDFPSVAAGRYLFAHVLERCEQLRRERKGVA